MPARVRDMEAMLPRLPQRHCGRYYRKSLKQRAKADYGWDFSWVVPEFDVCRGKCCLIARAGAQWLYRHYTERNCLLRDACGWVRTAGSG